MSYSLTDWATHILRKSSTIGEDESPTAAQLSEVQNIVRSRVSYLAIHGIGIWNGSEDVVPDEWYDPGADYMALYARQAFGGPPPGADEVSAAIYPLRVLSSTSQTGVTAQAEYF